MAHKNH